MISDNKYNNEITVSIIIVNYNTAELTLQCLASIYENADNLSLEVFVVDNASHDDSVALIKKKYPNVVLIENNYNEGFSKANNSAIKLAKGMYLLLLNSDTLILPGAIELLVRFIENKNDASAVGPKLLNADMSLQRSWFDFPSAIKTLFNITGISKILYRLASSSFGMPSFLQQKQPAFLTKNVCEPMTVDYLILACLLIRHDVIDEIGMLDENLFFYHEDCELGYRFKMYRKAIYYYPNANIIHYGGSSSSRYKLETYRHNFKSLLYVMSKYCNFVNIMAIRGAIISGMLIRVFFGLFGFYRDIDKLGIYSNDKAVINNKLKPSEVNKTYIQIIKDCFSVSRTIP